MLDKGDEPRLCSVYKRPEKHIAAIPMKKTKSAAMARRALVALVSEGGETIREEDAYRTTTLFFTAKNAKL